MMLNRLYGEFYFTLGQKSMNGGRLDEALSHFKKASSSLRYFQIDCYRALCLALQGMYGEAEKIVHTLSKKHPEEAIVFYYSGLCFFERGKFAEAERSFLSALDKIPDNAVFKGCLGLSLLRQGKKEAALECLRYVCNDIDAEVGGKLMYFLEKDILDAESGHQGAHTDSLDCLWGEGTKQIHVHAPSHIGERLLICMEGSLNRCFLNFIFLFQREKREKRKRLCRGLEKIAAKHFGEAIHILEGLLQCGAEPGVREALFYAYVEDKEFRKAQKTFTAWVQEELNLSEPVIDNIGDDAELALKVGTMYFALKDYGEALKWFAKSASADPKNCRSFYYMGLCFVTQGKTRDAIASFTSALKQLNQGLLSDRLKAWNRCVCARSAN